jgi:hypothetical protein
MGGSPLIGLTGHADERELTGHHGECCQRHRDR